MPFFWIKEGSNFVAIKFSTPSTEKVTETFASPAGSDGVDPELVAHFKTLVVGDAIEINFKDSGLKTERSLKVRVNKMAGIAGRHLDWRAVDGGNFIARVDEVKNPDTSANGSATSTPSNEVTVVDTPLQETPQEAGNRRGR
jgi:hypothetical protein